MPSYLAGCLAGAPLLVSGRSRAITTENLTGAKGVGGKAASNLGAGRKGWVFLSVGSGETVVLAEFYGAGAFVLRDLVLRMYWDGDRLGISDYLGGDAVGRGAARRSLLHRYRPPLPGQFTAHRGGPDRGDELLLPDALPPLGPGDGDQRAPSRHPGVLLPVSTTSRPIGDFRLALCVPQEELPPEQQEEFSKVLESGKAVWYDNYCWIVMEHYGPEGGQVNFVLTKVPDRECFPLLGPTQV